MPDKFEENVHEEVYIYKGIVWMLKTQFSISYEKHMVVDLINCEGFQNCKMLDGILSNYCHHILLYSSQDLYSSPLN